MSERTTTTIDGVEYCDGCDCFVPDCRCAGWKERLEDLHSPRGLYMRDIHSALKEIEALRAALLAASIDGEGECWCGEFCFPGDHEPACAANKKLLLENAK